MDNLQGSLDAAWIAGIWLADGTFGLNVHQKKMRSGTHYTRWAPQIVLAMKDHDVIEHAYKLLRRNGIGAWMGKRSSGPSRFQGDRITLWQVGIRTWGKAAKMLDWIAPHLVGRKLVSASILRMLVHETQGGAGHFTEDEVALRQWAHQAIKIANSGTEPSETIMAAPPPQVDEEIVQALREILGST
jgi:hypothetical protein